MSTVIRIATSTASDSRIHAPGAVRLFDTNGSGDLLSVPFRVDGDYVVPRSIPYGQLRVEVPDTTIAPMNFGAVQNVRAVALGEHSHQKVSGPVESLVDVRDGGIRQPGHIAGGFIGPGVRHFVGGREDGPELLATGPAPRPFVSSYCGGLSGKLIESTDASLAGAVRELAQEVRALSEQGKRERAAAAVMIFGHDTGSAEALPTDDLVKQVAELNEKVHALRGQLTAERAATSAIARAVLCELRP